MLKLIKYEFRKAQTAFLVLLGITAALEAYYLVSLHLEREEHFIISILLLMVCAYAVAIFAFVRGVNSYSSELKSRSSYLIFMTPNSTLKIMGSKFLYTFANGLFFAVLFSALACWDIVLMMKKFGEYEDFLNGLNMFLGMYGVHLDRIAYAGLFMVAYMFLSVLSVIAIAYLAITLSSTLFRDKKWRWIPTLVLFFGMTYGVSWLNGLFPSPVNELVAMGDSMAMMEEAEMVGAAADMLWDVIVPALIPAAGISLGTILVSLFGCAAMLKYKVSL